MNTSCFIFLVLCVTFAASFDLSAIIRVAQCRMQCIKKHSNDGSCNWLANRDETICSECWRNCESLETQWEATKFICETHHQLSCPACRTACDYRLNRPEVEFLPSSLPAPSKGPVKLGHHDIAVVLHRVSNGWQLHSYFPGTMAPTLAPDSWILAILEDGVKHYSWQEWRPTLDALKSGELYEATLSWHDMEAQLKRQRALEQKKFKDRVRQAYLEKYGEKVRIEWRGNQDVPIPQEIFRKFFFNRSKNEDKTEPITIVMVNDMSKNHEEKVLHKNTKSESFVVSWEPEGSGLQGNQVVDSKSAQISLLPGTKYRVRIASNDGPGSFPIEIDTRPLGSVEIRRVKKNVDNFYFLAIVAATVSVCLIILAAILARVYFRIKNVKDEVLV